MTSLKLLIAVLCLSLSALASDVTFSWNLVPAQTGVVVTKYNIYQVTTSGAETTNGPATFSTPVVATGTSDTSFTALNVAPGVYFAKISAFGTVSGAVKEGGLSNETTYVVPAAVIIMGVPVQQPVQVITH